MARDAQTWRRGEENSAPVVPLGLGSAKMLRFTHAIPTRMSLSPPVAVESLPREAR